VTTGQTPVLDPAEARALLDSMDVSTHACLRDRALIGVMVTELSNCRGRVRIAECASSLGVEPVSFEPATATGFIKLGWIEENRSAASVQQGRAN
jgi:hypothetical protein